jgi:3-isopropylmalate/(R)-2-methylmalate dehydratase large subunit
MTLCNMVVEAGGKNGVVPADSTTFKYLEVCAIDHYMPRLSLHALRFMY